MPASVVVEAASFRPRRLYTLRKMLLPEPPSDPQCTAAVPTELASAKWSTMDSGGWAWVEGRWNWGTQGEGE